MKSISIDKSIEKKRLVYQFDVEIIFLYIFFYFMSLGLPVVTVMVFISDKQHHREPLMPFYIFFTFIDFWMIAGMYFANKLYQFNTSNLIEHKGEITSLLEQYYPGIEFHTEGSNLIRGEKELGWLKMRARIITIILTDESIYVNILNTYRGENFSPIQGLYNYYRSKMLSEYIYKNLSSSTQI